MAQLIIQPAGNRNAREHYVNTVLHPVPLEQIRPHVATEVMDRLNTLYRGSSVPTWGFTPGTNGSNIPKWKRIESGDIALFLQDKAAFASATVSFKLHSPALGAALWDYDDRQQTWEYIYFLDEVQRQHITYGRLNTLLQYGARNNFQQALVLDEVKSEPVLLHLGLESELYESAPSKSDYFEAVAPHEGTALDKQITSKARTEQAYLRAVNFRGQKYAQCGICGREYPVSFLVAAHIKKRAECNEDEKRDFEHIAMPMCKFGCDELYEQGYIGVQERVIVALDDNLSQSVLDYLHNVENNPCFYWSEATQEYFAWHNLRMKVAG